jgi:hypothetical protein
MITQLVWLFASILLGGLQVWSLTFAPALILGHFASPPPPPPPTPQAAVVLWNVGVIVASMGGAWAVSRLRLLLRWVTWPVPSRWRRKREVWQAMRQLRSATSYEQWLAAARQLDALEGGDEWRAERTSDEFDWALVEETTSSLKRARKAGDTAALAFVLRTVMHRGYGGIDRASLYSHAHTGTKHTIDAFLQEVNKGLDAVSAASDAAMPTAAKAEFFESCRLSLGRTALALSGGGSLAMTHMGVVRTLLSAGLMPRVVAGTSGGAIVAAMLALHTDDELLTSVLVPDVVNRYGVRFFDPLLTQIGRFIRSGLTMGAPRMVETSDFVHTLQVRAAVPPSRVLPAPGAASRRVRPRP